MITVNINFNNDYLASLNLKEGNHPLHFQLARSIEYEVKKNRKAHRFIYTHNHLFFTEQQYDEEIEKLSSLNLKQYMQNKEFKLQYWDSVMGDWKIKNLQE